MTCAILSAGGLLFMPNPRKFYFDPVPAEWPRCEECSWLVPTHAEDCSVLASWADLRPTRCPCCDVDLPADPCADEWPGCSRQSDYMQQDADDDRWLDARLQLGWHGLNRRLTTDEQVRAFVTWGELVEYTVVQRRVQNTVWRAEYRRLY